MTEVIADGTNCCLDILFGLLSLQAIPVIMSMVQVQNSQLSYRFEIIAVIFTKLIVSIKTVNHQSEF